MDSMRNHPRRRWGVGLVAGLVAFGALGMAPVQAQSVPIIVPPISVIVVGIPPSTPSLVIGFPGDSQVISRGGLTWSTSGRADVDVDIDISRQHGQVSAS